MSGLRMMVLTLGLMALLTLVMPTAMAKFSGQHQFVNGSEVDCAKCHIDVYDELTANPDAPHANRSCKFCHTWGNESAPGFWKDPLGLDLKFHAAATIACDNEYCHGKAGANVTAEITNTSAAHTPFYESMHNEPYLQGGNEACVGCHTQVKVNVTISEAKGFNITATSNGTDWNITFSIVP
jgi:hypothetical protein